MTTAIITGASQGIGAAIARELFRRHRLKLLLFGRSAARLGPIAEETRADAFECDVTDELTLDRHAAKILETYGPPVLLINNVGQFKPAALVDTSAELFRRQMDVNVTGAFLITKAFLPAMIERGQGHVFYMASVASIRAFPGAAAYCASKHGLLGLARTVRAETLDTGIRVTTLMPGATLTPSWDGTPLPEGRFIDARDVARTLADIYDLSGRTVVEEVTIRPLKGDI